MFGDIEEARIVSLWDIRESDEYEYDAPPGFTYIGEGASRIAFKSDTTGIVYKKQYSHLDTENQDEYEAIVRLKNISLKGWRLPECHLYNFPDGPIIAMEYIEGSTDIQCQRAWHHWSSPCNCTKPFGVCSAEAWEQPQAVWGITDIHTGNIVVEESGVRVLIDLGE